MKNRQKSRSGCRTCKTRRLRCDETRPACRNCAQKGYECPGYQQRLQWSTKHERPMTTQASGPANFTQLVTAASESIVSKSAGASSGLAATKAPVVVPVSTGVLAGPSAPSSSSSASLSSCSSTATLSPSPGYDEAVASAGDQAALVPVAIKPEPALAEEADNIPDLPLLQPVVDMPTFLIEHWFNSVCSTWSALDSPSNPYRRLTADLWHTSTPVFYALQAISAASLVERLPHVMRDTARSATQRAIDAIGKELAAFSTGYRPKFPNELLLSLFCMSSSMCWMEARQLGEKFVRQARAVLKSLDGRTLDPEAQELLDFFNGCLVYEEMLRSVVSDDEVDFQNMLSWPEPATHGPLVRPVPHPWTGVPSDILRLFGKAAALCRRSRTRWRHNDGTSYRILQSAMKDIEEAKRVEAALLLAECRELPLTSDRAQDLHHMTEAYRLCALLQLYEAFPDLSTNKDPNLKDAEGSVVWQSCVSPLALQVSDILGKVPPGSLSCIQPLLCLCVGSGLRYDAKVPLGRGADIYFLSADSSASSVPATGLVDTDVPLLSPGISEAAIKTSQARLFVMTRLEQLETFLPPKPIGVAKELLRAVWTAYDEEIGLARRTHWLDVMSYTGLHSIFG